MRDRGGQFFALYLVFITLFMMGVVAGLYFVSYKNVRGALVSPMAVLKMRDSLEIFEVREMELIKSSLEEAKGDFCSGGFASDFRGIFIDKVMGDKQMKDFIFSNLTLKGRNIEKDARASERDFLENVLYLKGLGPCDNGERFFIREKIGKGGLLKAKGRKYKISFPIRFNFEFERKYSISKGNNGFEVSVV